MTNPEISAPTLTLSTPRQGSLRPTLLGLALVPALALGVTWGLNILGTQAATERGLLVQGATQVAQAFSDRVLDLGEQSGQSLADAELRAGVQVRAEDLLRAGTLPLTDVVVTDQTGAVVVAYDRTAVAGTGSAEEGSAQAWKASRAALAPDVQALAQEALKTGRPATQRVTGALVTLTAVPVPGGAGVTVLGLDERALNQNVQAHLREALVLLGIVLLLSVLAASVLASSLIGRVKRLTAAADRVSKGELDVVVPTSGKDELSTLGQAVDRLKESMRIMLDRL